MKRKLSIGLFFAAFTAVVVAVVAFSSWSIAPLVPETSGTGTRLYAVQDTPQVVNNSATFVATDLSTPIAARQKMHIRYYVPFTLGGTAGGIKFLVNAPNSPTSYVASCAIFTDADTLGLTTTVVGEAAMGVTLANAGTHWAIIDVSIVNGTTSGSVVLEFAQNSAQNENCIVLEGAYAEIVKY